MKSQIALRLHASLRAKHESGSSTPILGQPCGLMLLELGAALLLREIFTALKLTERALDLLMDLLLFTRPKRFLVVEQL